jgi:hypothetical protein
MAKFVSPFLSLVGVALWFPLSQVQAGDGNEPRREFRQSSVYPYTFLPVSYLQTGGPKAMRFAAAQGECAHRDAPLLPSPTPAPSPITKTTAESTQEAHTIVAASSPAPTPNLPPPAYPPPTNAPAAGGPDFSKVPDEVMSYFKNPYNVGPHGPHLFDPIFEPGYSEGPKSQATFQVSDKP